MKEKAKRLLLLHLLGIKIAEPYPRIISRLFEFLDFEPSKDIIRQDVERYKNITEKFNKEGKQVCLFLYDILDKTKEMKFGYEYNILSRDIYEECFIEGDIRPLLKALTVCILKQKRIIFHKVAYIGQNDFLNVES